MLTKTLSPRKCIDSTVFVYENSDKKAVVDT